MIVDFLDNFAIIVNGESDAFSRSFLVILAITKLKLSEKF